MIRTYFDATRLRFPSWKKITDFDLPSQPQGESITAPAAGDEVWVGSEGERSQVLAVPLPDLTADGRPTQPSTTDPADGADRVDVERRPRTTDGSSKDCAPGS